MSKGWDPANDDDESINAKEFINDFATDEFVNKNVRVRPISSMSGGKIKEESEHNTKSGMGYNSSTGAEDDWEKTNMDIRHDLDLYRAEQKERRKREEEMRLLEIERAEKKKKQKQ